MTRNERFGLNVPLDPGPRRRARRTAPLLLCALALLLAGATAWHRLGRGPRGAQAAAMAAVSAPQAASLATPDGTLDANLPAAPAGPDDLDRALEDPPEDGSGS